MNFISKILLLILLFIGTNVGFAFGQDTDSTKNDPQPTALLDFIEKQASFPGGDAKLMEFIKENLVLPPSVLNGEIQGRVAIRMVIEKDGSLTNVEVVRGLSPECDAAALDLMAKMPKWEPANQGPVRQRYVLPIFFKHN